MMNFEDELRHYEPLPELDELTDDVNPEQLADVLSLVRDLAKRNTGR